jgi:rod shape-determining protein MreC
MNVIIRFIQANAFYFFFGLLQLICLLQVLRFNSYQQTFYFNTSRGMVGAVVAMRQDVMDYFYLKTANEQLLRENLELRRKLSENFMIRDTASLSTAKVVQSSTNRMNNFITLNAGAEAGVKPGMAVLAPSGIVGVVFDVSPKFSLVLSVLNSKFRVSPMIRELEFREGFISWDGKDPNFVQLNGVNKFEKLRKGLKVYTSQYSPNFPDGIEIGSIADFRVPGNSSFYEINVQLSTSFTRLGSVYIVKDIYRPQIDSLNNRIEAFD